MFNYDFDEYGQKYWLCPNYPAKEESFISPPEQYLGFPKRKKPFIHKKP